MKIVGCQLDVQWEDKSANFSRLRALLAEDRPPKGSLIILPEMFATGFSMNVAGIAEGSPSKTEQFLSDLAKEHQAAVLGGLVYQGNEGKGRNEAVFIQPDGGIAARYSKLQPFSYAGETDHYEAGESVVTFEYQGFTVAPFICYDLRFPEHFRTAARRGANLFAVIANWPEVRIAHWITLLQARAIENQAFVIGVNRCGSDPNVNYSGCSLIVNPRGEIIASAGADEEIVQAEVDLNTVNSWRTEFPALKDMRDTPNSG